MLSEYARPPGNTANSQVIGKHSATCGSAAKGTPAASAAFHRGQCPAASARPASTRTGRK